nr:hypothetical protein [Trichocoleus desertorum]
MKSEFPIPYQTGAKPPQASDPDVKSISLTPPNAQEPAKEHK